MIQSARSDEMRQTGETACKQDDVPRQPDSGSARCPKHHQGHDGEVRHKEGRRRCSTLRDRRGVHDVTTGGRAGRKAACPQAAGAAADPGGQDAPARFGLAHDVRGAARPGAHHIMTEHQRHAPGRFTLLPALIGRVAEQPDV